MDVPAQYLLSRAALPEVRGWILALAAPAVALWLAALVHTAAFSFLCDRDRPARSIRLCRLFAGLTLVATGHGAMVSLFARQASPEVVPYIVSPTSVSLWAVDEALPLSPGFAAGWAHMLAQPTLEARKLRRVRDRIALREP